MLAYIFVHIYLHTYNPSEVQVAVSSVYNETSSFCVCVCTGLLGLQGQQLALLLLQALQEGEAVRVSGLDLSPHPPLCCPALTHLPAQPAQLRLTHTHTQVKLHRCTQGADTSIVKDKHTQRTQSTLPWCQPASSGGL